VRKRPCRECRRWFEPSARAGKRQHTCGSAECQQKRHARACRAWHASNPEYDRENRLRSRLVRAEEPGSRTRASPLERVDWAAARGAGGLQVAVLVEETGKVLLEWARDAVSSQVRVPPGESGQVPPRPARDAFAPPRAPP